MARPFVLDVSAYQPQAVNTSFWAYWKARGVQGGIVKLSEGTGWVNTYAQGQVNAIKATGLVPSGYHFSNFVGNVWQAHNEAALALRMARGIGLPAGSAIVLDYEQRAGYRGANTQAAIAFLNDIKAGGFKPVFYSYSGMASLWDYNAIYNATGAPLWIAAYPTMAGVTNANFGYFPSISDHTGAWQFTDNFYGAHLDCSVDLTGIFTSQPVQEITSGGYLDTVNFNGNQVHVAGWFGSDKTAGKPYRYIIITDDKITHEYARLKVDAINRPDVTKAYSKIRSDVGFAGDLPYTADMAGKVCRIIFRYTDDPAGNGNAVDFSAQHTFNSSEAWLDSLTGLDNVLRADGWFAADQSIGKQYRFVILWDTETHREIARAKVQSIKRDDVQNAKRGTYGADMSGFSALLPYDANLVGHDVQVIARYSDSANGEGHYVDYWFKAVKYPQATVTKKPQPTTPKPTQPTAPVQPTQPAKPIADHDQSSTKTMTVKSFTAEVQDGQIVIKYETR